MISYNNLETSYFSWLNKYNYFLRLDGPVERKSYMSYAEFEDFLLSKNNLSEVENSCLHKLYFYSDRKKLIIELNHESHYLSDII